MNKFNVGDTVFDLRYGFGVVEPLRSSPPLTIAVNYKTFERVYYTNGKWYEDHLYPSLLTLEEAAKLGYFPEKKKVKKQTDAWVILDPTIGCCIEILNQNPIPLNFFRDGSYHKNCIVVKTTLEWEVEE